MSFFLTEGSCISLCIWSRNAGTYAYGFVQSENSFGSPQILGHRLVAHCLKDRASSGMEYAVGLQKRQSEIFVLGLIQASIGA